MWVSYEVSDKMIQWTGFNLTAPICDPGNKLKVSHSTH